MQFCARISKNNKWLRDLGHSIGYYILFFVTIVAVDCVGLLSHSAFALAADSKSVAMQVPGGGSNESGNSSVAVPDLFSGAMSYSIPIEVPPGRNGMDASIALRYQSNNGNGWIGVGWDLDLGSIQRSVKNGVNYNDDNSLVAGIISE